MDCQPEKFTMLKLKMQNADCFYLSSNWTALTEGLMGGALVLAFMQIQNIQNLHDQDFLIMSKLSDERTTNSDTSWEDWGAFLFIFKPFFSIQSFHYVENTLHFKILQSKNISNVNFHFYLNQHCSFCFHHNFQQRFNQCLRGSWDQMKQIYNCWTNLHFLQVKRSKIKLISPVQQMNIVSNILLVLPLCISRSSKG